MYEWAYGRDNATGDLEKYITDGIAPYPLTHEEWILRLAQSRGNAKDEDDAWTIDWRYHEGVEFGVSQWRLGVGGWPLEKAVEQLSKTTGAYEHRLRNMITGEIIPDALFV